MNGNECFNPERPEIFVLMIPLMVQVVVFTVFIYIIYRGIFIYYLVQKLFLGNM